MEQFDEQLKEIDQQIQEVSLQKMKEAVEKSTPKVKSIVEKEALAAQMQSRSQGLMQDIRDGLDKAAEILEENQELSAEKLVDSDAACTVKPAPKPQEDVQAEEQADASAPQS